MTTNLYAALVAAQAEIQPVGKSSTNEHHRYKYASGDDIVAEARRALNANGLAIFALASNISEHPYSWEDDKGGVHEDVQLRMNVTFRLVHTSGESHDFAPFSVPVLPEKGRPLDKAEAGARTYVLSYFLRELLLIPRVDDAKQGEADPDTRDDRNHEPRRTKPGPPRPVREAPSTREHEVAAAVEKTLAAFPARADEIRRIANSARSVDERLADLRALWPTKTAPAAPVSRAAPEQVTRAQKLIDAARLEDPEVRAACEREITAFTRGTGKASEVGAGDIDAFISALEAIINGSSRAA